MNGDDLQEPGVSNEEVEFAETAARYDEVLSKYKLLRSRLLLMSANSGVSKPSGKRSDLLDVIESLDKMEEQFDRLSIQEEMLKEIKMSTLALELLSTEGPYDGLDDMLKEHCANQAKLFELSKSIRSERLAQKDAISGLLDRLLEYTLSLKDDQAKLKSRLPTDSDSTLQLKNAAEKQIKEIRFMKICISQIIAKKNVDLRENDTIKQILESARTPVTSVDNFL
ncbi:hypothetical protein ONE63_002506 [Megalurothrips usitatus]|uniref:Uncharacterized protein n=1 Tax=Megalurothrips usitatus TaxID=439358 RepID=A0AAV7XBD7_9NEOP|nr:hypothetical protein ONE63_002506 [Megalurothrips usitatus]